ncbi:MAG TPA: lipid-A-disaccharide synthase, partial [Gammaproteobacteria bacterium]|nr:lipid-A-disaccharide synthase [Gammaproteobacteria bacterium]MCH78034.1 lipid-A-disaccharide synthase [Gammaproteobacteria bacterium]
PMVVAYRLAPLTYAIARRLVRTPHVAIPNLLAGERLVPEFIQHAATPAA